jgi:hypothetical protein
MRPIHLHWCVHRTIFAPVARLPSDEPSQHDPRPPRRDLNPRPAPPDHAVTSRRARLGCLLFTVAPLRASLAAVCAPRLLGCLLDRGVLRFVSRPGSAELGAETWVLVSAIFRLEAGCPFLPAAPGAVAVARDANLPAPILARPARVEPIGPSAVGVADDAIMRAVKSFLAGQSNGVLGACRPATNRPRTTTLRPRGNDRARIWLITSDDLRNFPRRHEPRPVDLLGGLDGDQRAHLDGVTRAGGAFVVGMHVGRSGHAVSAARSRALVVSVETLPVVRGLKAPPLAQNEPIGHAASRRGLRAIALHGGPALLDTVPLFGSVVRAIRAIPGDASLLGRRPEWPTADFALERLLGCLRLDCAPATTGALRLLGCLLDMPEPIARAPRIAVAHARPIARLGMVESVVRTECARCPGRLGCLLDRDQGAHFDGVSGAGSVDAGPGRRGFAAVVSRWKIYDESTYLRISKARLPPASQDEPIGHAASRRGFLFRCRRLLLGNLPCPAVDRTGVATGADDEYAVLSMDRRGLRARRGGGMPTTHVAFAGVTGDFLTTGARLSGVLRMVGHRQRRLDLGRRGGRVLEPG